MNYLSKEQFLKELKRLRKSGKLTQKQLADKSGLSLKSISLLERGLFCTEYTLTRIAKAMGLQITWQKTESFTIKKSQNETGQ